MRERRVKQEREGGDMRKRRKTEKGGGGQKSFYDREIIPFKRIFIIG